MSTQLLVFIPEGKTAKANGRDHQGPVYIARKSTLGEVSFVALGADDNTEARVAAGMVDGDETDDAGDDTETTDDLEPVNASLNMTTKTKTEPNPKSSQTSPVEQMRAEAAAESRRIAGIRKLCAGNHPTIEADAIEQGWSITKTELAVLRSDPLRSNADPT